MAPHSSILTWRIQWTEEPGRLQSMGSQRVGHDWATITHSHHFMENSRGKSGSSDIFYFLGLQDHCGWWLQPWNWKMLALWKKSYDKTRQHIKKQRHHFADKGPYSSYVFFPVVMYGCESWTIKKAECWTIGVFKLWCWRRLLRVP